MARKNMGEMHSNVEIMLSSRFKNIQGYLIEVRTKKYEIKKLIND